MNPDSFSLHVEGQALEALVLGVDGGESSAGAGQACVAALAHCLRSSPKSEIFFILSDKTQPVPQTGHAIIVTGSSSIV